MRGGTFFWGGVCFFHVSHAAAAAAAAKLTYLLIAEPVARRAFLQLRPLTLREGSAATKRRRPPLASSPCLVEPISPAAESESRRSMRRLCANRRDCDLLVQGLKQDQRASGRRRIRSRRPHAVRRGHQVSPAQPFDHVAHDEYPR